MSSQSIKNTRFSSIIIWEWDQAGNRVKVKRHIMSQWLQSEPRGERMHLNDRFRVRLGVGAVRHFRGEYERFGKLGWRVFCPSVWLLATLAPCNLGSLPHWLLATLALCHFKTCMACCQVSLWLIANQLLKSQTCYFNSILSHIKLNSWICFP